MTLSYTAVKYFLVTSDLTSSCSWLLRSYNDCWIYICS